MDSDIKPYAPFWEGLNVPPELYHFHGGSAPQRAFLQDNSLLTVATIRGFVHKYLLSSYDVPVPIPDFHEMLWRMAVCPYPFVAIASPRDSAKTTAITHTFGLASLLFRVSDYALLVSDTETQAIKFLEEMRNELTENNEMREDFQIEGIVKDTQTVIEVLCKDGYRFRVETRGAEQRCRGLKWRGRKPNLLLVDDVESDALVESDLRRDKMRRWFYNALLPACSRRAKIRVAGTVLHFDSLLRRLLHDPGWFTCTLKSSDSPTKFDHILWSERLPKEALLAIRAAYKRQHNLGGYSQEYYNDPISEEDAFFKKGDFSYIDDDASFPANLTLYAAYDFAISKAKQAAFTCVAVIGVSEEGRWYGVHVDRGHWDAYEIMASIFAIHKKYSPELIAVEKGQIWDTLEPIFNTECRKLREFPRTYPVQAIVDKKSRARALQFKMKAGLMYWDRNLPWFDECYLEMIRFDRGATKDQVDALSWAGRMIEDMISLPQAEEAPDIMGKTRLGEELESFSVIGDTRDSTRNQITGY